MFAVAPLRTGGKGAPLHAGLLVLVLHKAAAIHTTGKALSLLAGWESWAPGARGRTQPRGTGDAAPQEHPLGRGDTGTISLVRQESDRYRRGMERGLRNLLSRSLFLTSSEGRDSC